MLSDIKLDCGGKKVEDRCYKLISILTAWERFCAAWLTSVGPPELLHAVPHQDDARQLRERLDDVEVAQGTHLEEGHAVLLGVGSRLLGGHLAFEGQVQAVADEDSRHARSMLGKKRGHPHNSDHLCGVFLGAVSAVRWLPESPPSTNQP